MKSEIFEFFRPAFYIIMAARISRRYKQCLRSRSSVQDRDRSDDRTPRDRKSKDRVSHVIFEVTTEYLFKTGR